MGIPDPSAVPSTHLSFMTTAAFGAPAGLQQPTWAFDLDVLPHPVQFGALYSHGGEGQTPEYVDILNSQLSGATHTYKYTALLGLAQRWRMTYCGVTLYQDGAALTNQGTMVAGQRPVHETELFTTTGLFVPNTAPDTGRSCLDNTKAVANRLAIGYQAADRLNFDNLTNMPNAYIGRSVDGCYMPLIMTETAQRWHGEHDSVNFAGGVLEGTEGDEGYTLAVSEIGVMSKWPFYGLPALHNDGTGTVVCGRARTSRFCSDIWGGICGRNLDPSTSFSVVFRYGFELQCQPGSIMTTQLRISPEYDPLAIQAYFSIRRQLKDAYPADFNDWAKIWKVIKQIGSAVLPAIGLLGPVGHGVATGLNGLGQVIDHFTVPKQAAEKGRNPLSLADVEKLRKGVVRTAATPGKAFRTVKKK